MRPLTVAALLLCSAAARADYTLPDAAERYVILVDAWNVVGEGAEVPGADDKPAGFEKYRVEVTRKSRRTSFAVDLFWLADRVNSNLICCGDHEGEMRRYLEKIRTEEGRPIALLVELVATEEGGPLFVAGVWKFDEQQAWKHAQEHGSPLLGLGAEQVKELGDEKAYEKKVREVCDEAWTKMSGRKMKEIEKVK